jgi:Spy/CpxP family protein refolding chaperone
MMMKTLNKLTLTVIAALGLGLISAAAFTAPETPCDKPGYGDGPRGPEGGPKHWAEMRTRWAEQMEALRAKLQLKPDQEELWKGFTAAQTAQREAMSQHWQRMRTAKLNTLEYFNNQVQFMEERLTGMKAVTKAAEDLYASLSPEQKAIMDDFFASRPRHKRGGPRFD